MIWSFVKIVYSTLPKQFPTTDSFRNASSQNLLTSRMLIVAQNAITTGWGDEKSDDKVPNHIDATEDEFIQSDSQKVTDFKLGVNQCSTLIAAQTNRITAEANAEVLNNIVYGDTELTVEHMDCIKSLRNGFLYIGPHDLTKNFSLPNDSMMNHDMQQNARNQAMSRNRLDASPVSVRSLFYLNRSFK